MDIWLFWGIVFPFFGTVAGAAAVFLPERAGIRRWFSAFGAVVMGAAAIFGLLVPGLKQSPMAALGAVLGAWLLSLPGSLGWRGWLVPMAVVLHNIPEGLATGVGFAAGAPAVGLGIGLQNLPDGAMVALPLRHRGMSKGRAFLLGAASGLVEPVASAVMLLFARQLTQALPVLMGFAAGAMGYVIVTELIPAAAETGDSESQR